MNLSYYIDQVGMDLILRHFTQHLLLISRESGQVILASVCLDLSTCDGVTPSRRRIHRAMWL